MDYINRIGQEWDATEVAELTMYLHYGNCNTNTIGRSDLQYRIRHHDKYLLTWVMTGYLCIDLDVIDDSKVEDYYVLDINTLPPIVLGKYCESGYEIVDGNHRCAVRIKNNAMYTLAFVPVLETKLLYHISLDTGIINAFIPRVPEELMVGENECTPRICVASNLEGCLSSAPWGGVRLEDTMVENEDEDEFSRIMRVYEFDTTNIPESSILTPRELYHSGDVPDAIYKNEHWILEPVNPVNTYLIELYEFEESNEDVLSYEDDMAIEDGACYDDVWDGSVTTVIENIRYRRL